jgi:hypothetical protein
MQHLFNSRRFDDERDAERVEDLAAPPGSGSEYESGLHGVRIVFGVQCSGKRKEAMKNETLYRWLSVCYYESDMADPDRHAAHKRLWKKYLRLTRGRVSILRALKVIGDEERDPAFKDIIFSIRKDLETDATLSEAIAKHASEFSPSIIELVKAAEQSGAWDEILQEIVDGLEDNTFE